MTLTIASPSLSADIAPLGAELQNLRDAEGRLLQWDGDPIVWTGRAPILFPVVGMLQGDRYRLGDRHYPMPKHGFARHARFDVVAHDAQSARLRLVADAATRTAYPFDFQLDIDYALVDATLRVTATVANHGADPMPASIGFHPAFQWPLPYGVPRAEHRLRFPHAEPAPIRRIDSGGFLRPLPQPTPVVGDTLVLRDTLFDDDAVIFDRLASRRVRYGASRGPSIDVDFADFPTLGVWTKPGGAHFVCIEPWHGIADPEGYDGDFFDKPGIFVVGAGASRAFTMTITLDRDPPH